MAKRHTNALIKKYMLLATVFLMAFMSFSMHSVKGNTVNESFAEKRVLFISSYSSAFNTFYRQIEGINDAFEGYPITVDMEFMDSKRFLTEENISNFYQSLSYKLTEGEDYDLLMVSDDNAMNFVMEYREDLFEDLPIVFFGINSEESARTYSQDPSITGIFEAVSIVDTIALAQNLNPGAEKVIALSDETPTAQVVLEEYYEHEADFPSLRFEEINLQDYSFEEFYQELSQIDTSSIVLLISALIDQDGDTLDFDDSLEELINVIEVPIYHLYDHGIGDGLLGGKVVSHYNQGKTAAEIVVSIFSGEDIASFTLLAESPNRYIIDYNILKRHGYEEILLPTDVILLNRDYSFFEQYQVYIFLALAFILVQSIIIIVSVWSLIVRTKAKKEALESKEALEQVNVQLKDVNQTLTYTSYHDYLTGLFNRNYFEEHFYQFEAEVYYPVSIVLVDVNGLKLINDAFGHMVGDEALTETARIMQIVFASSIICRIGGDEFAIITTKTKSKELLDKMQDLRDKASHIYVSGVQLSVSLGMALKHNKEKTMNELFTEAEDWMYREKLNQVPSNRSSIIETIIATIHQKDEYSQIHSKRVSLISTYIAKLLDLEDQIVGNIKTAGLLHDIGKIIIPTHILNKKGTLTKSEYEEIKKHSEIGYRILNSVSSMREIAELVFCHHERMDGKGYPRGLKASDIPIESQIIAVADAMDTMLNDRHYREKLSREACAKELETYKGSQFSSVVVDVVLKHFNEVCDVVQTPIQEL